jgi:SAM-dependent methyltransferase
MRLGVLRHLAGNAVTSVRRAGLRNTGRIIASTVRDSRFDRTYGTDTAGYADPRVYAPADPRAERAHFYVPTRAEPFLAFLRRAGVPASGTFVDFGCGKGRALLLAAQHGFRSVTGIDFSPALCRSAECNIELFQARAPGTRFEVICGDAGDYEVRPNDAVFYFYDPFHDEVIERCLDRVKASIDDRPRQIAVIYHNNFALRPTPFDTSDLLVETPQARIHGNAFYLFKSSTRAARHTANGRA